VNKRAKSILKFTFLWEKIHTIVLQVQCLSKKRRKKESKGCLRWHKVSLKYWLDLELQAPNRNESDLSNEIL